ncbi:L-asparaginase [Pueribacillus theae]|uniref:asparaginase n=1 Tax=Pueribacillus theae TaxID=2171751 RepID=A0A2U1K662_9BACI|nr:asparaginase [Pueribacillus theae]PWA12398.1 L-asparaginase [Pueribacillus theae]
MKKILIVHTGGTIAMKENQAGGVSIEGKHPLSSFQERLASIASITTEHFSQLPSAHISPQIVLEVAKKIKDLKKKEQFDGVVITHGTDTLEETAYMLDLLFSQDCPIVLTGAMKSSNELGSDGPSNLMAAVRVAGSNEASGMGVLVVMNDEVHSAKYVTKTHTSSIAAFESPQNGPVGIVTKKDVVFFYKPLSEENYSIETIEKNVLLLKAYSGMGSELFEAIEQIKIDGIVIEAMGQGNLPPHIVPSLEKMIANDIPIVLVSRSQKGFVQPVYDYEGGGKQLKKKGVIFSNGLSGQKARLKLLIALQTTNDFNQLEKIFAL